MTAADRRAPAILQRLGHPQYATPRPPRRPWPAIAAAVVLVLAATGIVWAAGDDPTPAAAPATDCPAPTPQQTGRYLSELALAGVPLPTPHARHTAASIGRTHIAHCHLVGMRWQIERDFHEQLPELTDQQITDARVAVEHHFLDVTGRKQ